MRVAWAATACARRAARSGRLCTEYWKAQAANNNASRRRATSCPEAQLGPWFGGLYSLKVEKLFQKAAGYFSSPLSRYALPSVYTQPKRAGSQRNLISFT